MKAEFDNLVKTMKSWDLFQQGDEVDCALIDLKAKIEEVEKRIECAVQSADEINSLISEYTERVDKKESFVMSIDTHDKIQTCSNDVTIALDLNDDMCIKDNWYKFFNPKEEPIEPFISFESSWGIITCARDGVILKVDGDLEINGERNFLFDIVKIDLVEYETFLKSIDKELDHDSEDILAVGFWKKDDSYCSPDFEWRKTSYSPEDDSVEIEVVPTSQCKKRETLDKVKQIIETLKTLDNGNCVDGETMSYIVSELGFDEYLMKALMMSSSNIAINDILAEKKELNGY